MKNSSITNSLSSYLPSSYGKVAFFLAAAFLGQWFLSDIAHIPGGALGLFVGGAAIWWAIKPSKLLFDSPETVHGWVKRCEEVQQQFQTLESEDQNMKKRKFRSDELEAILERSEPQQLGFLSTKGVEFPDKEGIKTSLALAPSLDISFSSSLPVLDKKWLFPKAFFEKDLLVYFLPLPLRAADLLWLETIPMDQPSWVMVLCDDLDSWKDQQKALEAQLPERWAQRILRWNGSSEDINSMLSPIRKVLEQPKKNLDITKQRLLSKLHSSWQKDLETLRREKFRLIQSRSQWIVAGAVFASPLPSSDLISVAVVNGLMVKEMSDLWACNIKPELLSKVAQQLAAVAIAQGVVEWSGQSLLGMAKLHGTSWIAAGTIQALSAAYLTRVVGRSMADWMALNNGVANPDLDLIKQQAPKLVANAAKLERVDWVGFIRQSKEWINDQTNNQGIKGIISSSV